MTDRPTHLLLISALVAAAGGQSACTSNPTAPDATVPAGTATQTAFAAVTPQGGATAVSPTTPIVMQFSRAMPPQMSGYASLHEGDVTGSVVPCTATWSSDSTVLTLMPSTPLHHGETYTLHMGGGMRDASGNVIDMTQHGAMMGGQWATGSMMMGGGMMSGGEMGPGWQGSNGMYGMLFRFTTA